MAFLRDRQIGTRAAIRVEPENHASVRVAQKSGFAYVHDSVSGTDLHPDGTPATLRLYVFDLGEPPVDGVALVQSGYSTA